ncbi:MAG TPA: CAP domain-containing protein [Myxococcales bacterium]
MTATRSALALALGAAGVVVAAWAVPSPAAGADDGTAAGSPPTRSEARLEAAVVRAYRASGTQGVPRFDAALGRAAQAIARRAAADGLSAATASDAVAREVSLAGGWDPMPRIIAARSPAAGLAVPAIEARTDLASMPATRLGTGVAQGEPEVAIVLLADRKAMLDPFPRRVSVGTSFFLSGRLVFPLYDGRVVVSGPRGVIQTAPEDTGERNLFSAQVAFPAPGEYSVEVVAQSIKGPEVAALFRVLAGSDREVRAAATATAGPVAENDDLAKAEAQVLAALNARRKAAGLKPLARSATLDSVASDHSAEMAKLGYFAHVSPVSGDLTARLARVGFAFRRAAENLGEAGSALDAHRSIEASPGHLSNVLDPAVDLVGLGTARVKRGEIDNVLLTEVFARAAP